jgi:hypothetical protein
MSHLGQKRPKLLWLPAAKSTTEQRVKFVPIPEVTGIEDFSPKCEPLHTRSTSRSAPFRQECNKKSGEGPDDSVPSIYNGGRYIRQSRDRGKFRDAAEEIRARR